MEAAKAALSGLLISVIAKQPLPQKPNPLPLKTENHANLIIDPAGLDGLLLDGWAAQKIGTYCTQIPWGWGWGRE